MCIACELAAGRRSWTEAGVASREEMDQARAARVRLLRRALGPYGVKVDASALGAALRLSVEGGGEFVTADVAAIWPWVEGVLGRRWDPLTSCPCG